jgi:ABC-2 type transport system ATP-binding protein
VERASAGVPVQVRSPRAGELRSALERRRVEVASVGENDLLVRGSTVADIGDLAAELRIPLHGLTPQQISLEDAFMQITHESVEYRTGYVEPELEAVA